MAELYDLRGFDAIHLASAVRLGEGFSDLRFLAFDDRLVEAAREVPVQAYGENECHRVDRGAVPYGSPRRGAARGLRVSPGPAVKAGRSSIIRANRARK
jgi:hypothetical protein